MESIFKNVLISIAAGLVISGPYLLEIRFRAYETLYEKNIEQIERNFTEVKQQLEQCNSAMIYKNKDATSQTEKNCQTCGKYLVSGPNGISDDMVTWSSVHDGNHNKFRLYSSERSGYVGAWCAGSIDSNQYIQVNFPEARTVTGIITLERDSGKASISQWVTFYKILYSSDMMTWETYKVDSDTDYIFPGNDGTFIPKTNCLSKPITAKAIRINPQSWIEHISLRFDIIGC